MDSALVVATMLFPADRMTRDAYAAMRRVDALIEGKSAGETVSIIVADIALLRSGVSQRELASKAEAATRQGVIAGALLKLIYERHVTGLPEPSLRKAIEEYCQFALTRTYGDKAALPRSAQTIRNAWDAFQSVAHLWGALEWAKDHRTPYRTDWKKRQLLSDPKSLKRVLGVAKAMGEFATTFVPKRTRLAKPIIDPEVLVKIPDAIPAVRLQFTDRSNLR